MIRTISRRPKPPLLPSRTGATQIQYRGTFENDPFMDTGWIKNNINCRGQDTGAFNYLIVHQTDRRYTGNPEWAVWGSWEFHVLTESGRGNVVHARPENAVGN